MVENNLKPVRFVPNGVTPACGYLVAEKENAQAYVSAIRELLDNQRRQEMGALARQRMFDHFSVAGLDLEYRTFVSVKVGSSFFH